jgi:hypothetical protein
MAFCVGCGKEMSDDAVACPECGKPAQANNGLSTKLKIGIILFPILFAWFTLRKGVSTSTRIISFVWMIAAVAISGGASQSDNPGKQNISSDSSSVEVEQVKKEVPKVSATKIYNDYDKNEISADSKYKGQYIEISGTIEDIGKDLLDNMYITLAASSFMGVQVFFNDEDSNIVGGLNKGMNIKVICKVEGLMGNVLCNDAAIIQ